MRIIWPACSAPCHASIVMLSIICANKVVMIAHTAYVPTAALEDVHSTSGLDCCATIVPTVSTVRYTLVFYSDVRYFWKKARLVACVKLVLVVDYIQLRRSHSILPNILIFHCGNMTLTILSPDSVIGIATYSCITCKLICIYPNLGGNTMIRLAILLLIINIGLSTMLTLTLTLPAL